MSTSTVGLVTKASDRGTLHCRTSRASRKALNIPMPGIRVSVKPARHVCTSACEHDWAVAKPL